MWTGEPFGAPPPGKELMAEVIVTTVDGTPPTLIPGGEATIDPVENALVVNTIGGRIRFYWPNVISVIEVDV